MIKEAKLIFDNNAHKCSITIDGKQQKITVAPFNEMSLTKAHFIIQQVNDIIIANYSFTQIIKMLDISEKITDLSRYSSKALHIVIKLLYQEELQKYIDSKQVDDEKIDTKRTLVILNIGCTSVGKTIGNLYALIPRKYVKNFLTLTSIKESTNFPIDNIVNPYDRNLVNKEEFEIEFSLKTVGKLNEDVNSLCIEALQEILDTIKSEVKSNNDNSKVWAIALKSGSERLRVNKDKTFDITNSVDFKDECDVLEKMLIKSIKDSFGKELQLDPLSSKRSEKDLRINMEDFDERFDLLDAFVDSSDRKIYKSYIREHYVSPIVNMEDDFIGDGLFAFAYDMVLKYPERKTQILESIAKKDGGVWLHVNTSNKLYPADVSLESKVVYLKNAILNDEKIKNDFVDSQRNLSRGM